MSVITRKDANDLVFRTREEAVEIVIRLMEERDALVAACRRVLSEGLDLGALREVVEAAVVKAEAITPSSNKESTP
jgi:hypothetical protein